MRSEREAEARAAAAARGASERGAAELLGRAQAAEGALAEAVQDAQRKELAHAEQLAQAEASADAAAAALAAAQRDAAAGRRAAEKALQVPVTVFLSQRIIAEARLSSHTRTSAPALFGRPGILHVRAHLRSCAPAVSPFCMPQQALEARASGAEAELGRLRGALAARQPSAPLEAAGASTSPGDRWAAVAANESEFAIH